MNPEFVFTYATTLASSSIAPISAVQLIIHMKEASEKDAQGVEEVSEEESKDRISSDLGSAA